MVEVHTLGKGAGSDPVVGWELVEAARGGDREAFGRLYERYVGMVFGFVLFRVGDRAVAEDITGETFLRALRGISSVSYRGRGIGAWFVTIARNLVLDYMKSSRFRFDSVVATVPDVGMGGPEDEVIERATRAELMRAVAALGRAQRECVVLRFLHGLSVAETAAVMGRAPATVKSLQHRAVRRLAQLVGEGPSLAGFGEVGGRS